MLDRLSTIPQQLRAAAMKTSYAAGDIVLIPFDTGFFCPGVVGARSGRSHVITCFIFSPCSTNKLTDCTSLSACKSKFVTRTSGKAIEQGHWKKIGRIDNWCANDWAVRHFRRRPIGSDLAIRVTYDPKNPRKCLSEEIDTDPFEPLPDETLHGWLALEQILHRLINTHGESDLRAQTRPDCPMQRTS